MNQTYIPNEVLDDSVFEEIAIKASDFCEAEIELSIEERN